MCSTNFEVLATPDFLKSIKALAKRYKSIKQDFAEFSASLRTNPIQGVELSPGIRKVRMAIKSKGRGKSGGSRVITYTVAVTQHEGRVYLLDIYDKADFSTVDVEVLKRLVRELGL